MVNLAILISRDFLLNFYFGFCLMMNEGKTVKTELWIVLSTPDTTLQGFQAHLIAKGGTTELTGNYVGKFQ